MSSSDISRYLGQIETAVYGEDVRGAIHDAIAECYDDVSTSATLANTAAANANEKAGLANTAAENANEKAALANAAAASITDEIDHVYRTISAVNAGEIVRFTRGKYISTNPSTIGVDPPTYITSANFVCACIPCSPGEQFTITGRGGSTTYQYLWTFTTSTGGKISGDNIGHAAKDAPLVTNGVITAPDTAAYLIFNSNLNSCPNPILAKNKGVSVLVNELQTETEAVKSFLVTYNDLNAAAAVYKNGSGKFDEGFSVSFRVGREPLTLGMTAQYTGITVPTVVYSIGNGVSDAYTSPAYDFGDVLQRTTKEWRVPPGVRENNLCTVTITIPSGTVVDITDIYIRNNVPNNEFGNGIWWQGHSGWTSMFPRDTIAGFQFGAKLGFTTMVTVPKFTSDNVGVCFHDETNITIDGVSKPISGWTYSDLCNYDLGDGARIPTLDDFFRICANCNMIPVLSVHATDSYTEFQLDDTGEDRFTRIKAISDKYGLTNKLWIKAGRPGVHSAAFTVFGENIGGLILLALASSSWGPLAQSKNIIDKDGNRFIPSTATSVLEAAAPLRFEMYYSESQIDNITSKFTSAKNADCSCSIASNSVTLSGATMRQLIEIGATGFCQDAHCSMGLDW